ncbi:MAG: type III pantothenate kinase [Pirellulaceae bacterium]
MTERTCLVAVDVGNSAVKLCVRRDPHTQGDASDLIDCSVPIAQSDWQHQAIKWVRDHVGCSRSRWRIASVHKPAAKAFEQAIDAMRAQSGIDMTVNFVSRHDVPMKANVDQPDRLGIDRLLSAFGAANLFQAPVTVVDAGSAVTVDWVNADGEFCGGAIMPGLRMQAASLAKGTDALPEIDWQKWNYQPTAASNTIDAIRLGLMTGVSAAIDRLVLLYASQQTGSASPEMPQLVLTGGDSEAISPFVRSSHQVVPNLVCRGLLDLQ